MHRRYTTDDHHEQGHGHHRGLPRYGLLWLAVAGLAVWAVTGVYVVQPNERAVVWRCGKVLAETSTPGIHVGLPYGIDRVAKVKMSEQKRVGIGLSLDARNLGRAVEPRRAECLTGDRNLILVTAIVQYDILNAKDYLTRTGDVAAVIENLATAALTSAVASMPVDEVLTVGRLEIQQKVRAALQERLGRLESQGQGLGVQINSVALQEVQPPKDPDVEAAFRDVVAAREDRQRTINEAQAYAAGLLPAARGEADRLRQEAEGYAARVQEQARGDSDRFARMIAELGHGRQLTIRRLILETLEDVLPRMKKIVLGDQTGRQLDLGLIEEEP